MVTRKRKGVWQALGTFLRTLGTFRGTDVLVLELGGSHHCVCPVDLEELCMALPNQREALANLHTLSLTCIPAVGDEWLHLLVEAGCGRRLTCLSLCGEQLCAFHLTTAWLTPFLCRRWEQGQESDRCRAERAGQRGVWRTACLPFPFW